ncbi:amino acid permease [Pseudomonas sp. Fl5BN2]|uniref:amino acid permease n=1 Tax=Pseudomonas sp. Fl5BN2 TaxID=2697652 RepID=UPI002115CD5B|nr:amino acid permease [Pseudomonas sp. Fl5BN2]
MAHGNAAVVGPRAAILVNIGLIIWVGWALLAWTMLVVEMLYLASCGDNHTAPAQLSRINAVETPVPALWLTNTLISMLFLLAFLNASSYNALIRPATSMALPASWPHAIRGPSRHRWQWPPWEPSTTSG